MNKVVAEVPAHEQLFVTMDANVRAGRRGGGESGSESNKVLGAYGWDEINDNSERLLSFAANQDLSLVNTSFRTRKGGASHTFNGRGKRRIDYILTRRRDRKLVRNVTVRRQPSLYPMSNHKYMYFFMFSLFNEPQAGFGDRPIWREVRTTTILSDCKYYTVEVLFATRQNVSVGGALSVFAADRDDPYVAFGVFAFVSSS